MISFKEFLRKEKREVSYPLLLGGLTRKSRRLMLGDYVSIQALGEWAFERFTPTKGSKKGVQATFKEFGVKEGFKIFLTEAQNISSAEPYTIPFLIIAIACLGEEVVRKRLEALK